MEKSVKKPLSISMVAILGVGAVIDVILFYYMFRFADQGNMLMVILTSLLIVVVAVGITRGIAAISRRQ